MSRRIMTDEQIAEAQRLRTTGLTISAVAEKLGFRRGLVRYALAVGETRDHIREASHRRTVIRNVFDKAERNRLLTPEQTAIAVDLRQRLGMKYRDIAATIGEDATAHRVRVSIIAALPSGQPLPRQQRMAQSSEERNQWRLARQQAREEAAQRQRELEYAISESAREQDERLADDEQRLRTGSNAPTDAEERERIGEKLFAINRAARSKLIDGG